VHIKSINTQD